MYELLVREPEKENLGLVILLPGRGQPCLDMINRYDRASNLANMRLIAVEPIDEWYPAPNGVGDQSEAIWGLKLTVPEFENFVTDLEREYEVDRANIVLAGFSAGAVLAIQVAANTDRPFGAVVVHNGAILDPESMLESKNNTPFLVFHNMNDDCFEWEERYLPMKEALESNNYDVDFIEGETGGHYIADEDVKFAGNWIKKTLNHPEEGHTEDSIPVPELDE